MAVPTSEDSYEVCTKCFQRVLRHAPACLEPGCPMMESATEAGSEAAVYPDIARANLLRMKGEYEEGRQTCFAILKRFPRNGAAHTLLGDIYAEEGKQLDKAIEWYELALEIAPESASDRAKLESVRQRKTHRDAVQTAEALGLPTTKSRAAWFAGILSLFVIGVGLAGFFIGRNREPVRRGPDRTPVVISGAPTAKVTPPERNLEEPTGISTLAPTSTPATSNSHVPAEDQALMSRLRSECEDGASILLAYQDLRTKRVIVTFQTSLAEIGREIPERLAASVLRAIPDAPRVTLRALVSGRVKMLADLDRADWDTARNANTSVRNVLKNHVFVDQETTQAFGPLPAPTSQPSS